MQPFQFISDEQPVRLGLLLNPHSRFNSRRDWLSEARRRVGSACVQVTPSIEDIPRALEHLLHREGVTVLGICGGDGTLHHTLNALLRGALHPDPSGRSLPIVPILPLRGGTLNMLARAIRVEGDPLRCIERFQRKLGASNLGSLPRTSLKILQIQDPDTRFGFIFGSEMTARCLELYEQRFGGGYRGLARFLHGVLTAFALKTPLWQEHRYLFEAPAKIVRIDGQPMAFRAVASSTIDIKLLGGLICGLYAGHGAPGTFRLRVLKEQSALQIMTSLHKLMLGREGSGILDFEGVQEIEIEPSEYSVDGEIFPQTPSPLILKTPVWKLPFVAPFR